MNNSQDTLVKEFINEAKKAQSQLTEHWLEKHTTNINLEKTIASLYIENYLENSKSDGYLMKNALGNICKGHGSDRSYAYLMKDRPYFPRGFDIEFNANEMIKDLKKSIYYSEELNKGSIHPDDIKYLNNKSKQVNIIITSLKEAHNVPQEIHDNWNTTMRDDWISNKLTIARYILKEKK
jgi:hypothetical protein